MRTDGIYRTNDFYIAAWLLSNGLQLEGIDRHNPRRSEFIFNIMAVVAALERQTISQRVRAGMDYSKRHGTKSGNKIGRKRYDVPFTIVCKALQDCCGRGGDRPRFFEEWQQR